MDKSNETLASVIILTKSQKDLLQKSIPAIKSQKTTEKFEIIVVDSGSTDGGVEYLKKENVKLVEIKPEEFGFGKAFNSGAKYAVGKYLIRLSGDAIPLNEVWLKELTEPFANRNIGAVYGRYILSGRKGYTYPNFWNKKRFPNKAILYSVKPTLSMGLFENKPWEEKFNRIFSLAGACYSIRKEIWQKRYLNENVLGGDDAEYAFFLHLIGYDVLYNPKAIVLHEHTIVRNRPTWYSSLMDIGISNWQIVLYREIIKLWSQRFFFRKYQSFQRD